MQKQLDDLIRTIGRPQQETRLRKVYTEEYYLLDYTIEEEEKKAVLKISGSTKNVYTVSIDSNEGKLWCDCPDMKSHAARHGVWCKHCCFTLLKVGKWYTPSTFIEKNVSEECFHQILERLHTVSGSEIVNTQLTNAFKSMQSSSSSSEKISIFDAKVREIGEEDECPICYDLLSSGEVKSCPECHQYVHSACIQKWLETRDTCVLCRSKEWKRFKKEESGSGSQYIKL